MGAHDRRRDRQTGARVPTDDRQSAQYSNCHGRSDGPGVPADLRPSADPRSKHGGAGEERRRIRQRLLQQSPVFAVARLLHVGPAAVAQPGLRQCGGVRRRRPDFRALPEASRLSNHPVGKDAFLRAGPVARVRRAADDRHLSRRLQLDARLGSSGRSSELVSQHELGPASRRMCALKPARLRRRGGVHGRARDLRYRAVQGSAAVPARGVILSSA